MFFFSDTGILPYFWLIMAIVFLLAEIGTPGLFFFVAFSAGFFASSIAAFWDISFFWQCWIALIGTVISFVILRYFFASKIKAIGKEITNTDALVGRKGIVVTEISAHKKGQVKIGGEIWSSIVDEDVVLKKDVVVKVVKVVGNKLIVRKF